MNASASQCSHFHHKTNNFDNGLTLDPSLYDMPMADPALRPVVEDGRRRWNYEALNAKSASDQDSPACDQSNDEMASNLAVSNQPEYLGMYSMSTSPISLAEEEPGEEPGSSLGQKLLSRKALSSSDTVEDDLSNPSENRQSNVIDREAGHSGKRVIFPRCSNFDN